VRVRSGLVDFSAGRVRLVIAAAALVALFVVAAVSIDRASADRGLEVYRGPAISTPDSNRCDWLDPTVCLQPWPNDYFTKTDKRTVTKKRLNLNRLSMPSNDGVGPGNPFTTAGTHVDPTEYNRSDGFSPGQAIVVHVDGMDNPAAFDQSGIVPLSDIGDYSRAAQPVVLINAKTGKRHPIFAELDVHAENDSDRQLIIRPTVNLAEGTRYVVALRNMKDAAGATIPASDAFRVYRDKLKTSNKTVEARRSKMESIFTVLKKAKIDRSSLYLAWDFTVASSKSLAGRVLSMRNDAFKRLGDTKLADKQVQGRSPAFRVDSVTNFSEGQNANLLRRIDGTLLDVPCYLGTNGCAPGAKFKYSSASALTPTFNKNFKVDVPFVCTIPRYVATGGTLHTVKPSLYGHGLLGSTNEMATGGTGSNIGLMANDHGYMFCATNWAGFSDDDTGVVLAALFDFSNFSKSVDRMQQGFINMLMLGRAMIHPQGFSTSEAFQINPADTSDATPANTQPVIDTQRLFYDGNSQGGIMGGALTAIAPDFDRAVLGVPGMNYSTLLQRSVDFDDYAVTLYASYPDLQTRPLLMSLLQVIWDRGEANGYAHHMTTKPYANTPQHQVLLHPAYGDHQVATLTAETEARTIGAKVRTPALASGRYWGDSSLPGLGTFNTYPYSGSALVYWDGGPSAFSGTLGSGADTAPLANEPPRPELGFGGDPHSYPRKTAAAREQKAAFLSVNGKVINVCGALPCFTNGWDGTLP